MWYILGYIAGILGGMIAHYLLYALLALIFRHKVGFIISSILSIGSKVLPIVLYGYGNFSNLISPILTILCIFFIFPIRIRND